MIIKHLLGKIKINVVQCTVEVGMLPRLFCLKMARMRGIYGVAQLARWRLTLISARANQRSNLVDVSSACRGELQRRGGPTGMCNTARPPSSSFNLSLSLSLSFLCSPRDFLKSLFQARPRTGRGARPAFLQSDTTLLNLNLLRSSANRRLAREKYFKKERAFLVIVSSQPGYSNLANLIPGKLDPEELFYRRSCTLMQADGLVKVNKI